jgi:hypothetical protein
LSLDDLNVAMIKSIGLYVKLVEFLSKWLATLDPAAMTVPDGLKAFQLLPRLLKAWRSCASRSANRGLSRLVK